MLLTHQMHNCLICQLPLSQPAILLQTEAHASSGWLLQGNCSCRADDSWLRFRGRQNHCTQGRVRWGLSPPECGARVGQPWQVHVPEVIRPSQS